MPWHGDCGPMSKTTPYMLYGYCRSTAPYRERIALNLKNIPYAQLPLDLRQGQQRNEAYCSLNPQGLVPAMDIGDLILTQSTALIEFLEQLYPAPPLLPPDT